METTKWFDRQFSFNHTPDEYPEIMARLKAAPTLLVKAVGTTSEDKLVRQIDGKWSIKEHIGHLSILEPLWRQRILDLQVCKKQLSPADLENTVTSAAGFNDYLVFDLIAMFEEQRSKTLSLLANTDIVSITAKSQHPRMLRSLSLADHLHFVAEHDDHHINHIRTSTNEHPKLG